MNIDYLFKISRNSFQLNLLKNGCLRKLTVKSIYEGKF